MKFGTRLVTTGLFFLSGMPFGFAQDSYPSRLIRIVVPTPPGGLTDVIGRIVGQRLSEAWKQPVIIDNRPGADEMLGGENVARSAPDGYSLLVASGGGVTATPQLRLDKRYDPVRDLTPVAMLGQITPVMIVPSSLPVASLKDLIDYFKARPGKMNFGSFGTGSYSHVAMEDFKKRTGTDLMHVPYKGAPPAYTAVVRAEIAVLISNLSGAMVHVNSGAAKIIAAAGPRRPLARPEIPTAGETVPGFSTGSWWGVFAPANLPRPILDKAHAELGRIVGTPEMRKVFDTNTIEPVEMTQAQLVQFVGEDQSKWARQFKEIGLKPE